MKLEFENKLGSGAFADVWLAKDLDLLPRQVAVKFFTDVDPTGAEKLALEHARALVRVEHASVVRVFAVDVQKHPETKQDALAIIMEYVEGPTLEDHSGSFSESEAKAILNALASGLDAIHTAGLIHNDFHPGNIVLTREGAKILDILYTRTLANEASRFVRQELKQDIRAFTKVAHLILDATVGVDRDRLVNAAIQSDRATSACRARDALFTCFQLVNPAPAISAPVVSYAASPAPAGQLSGFLSLLAQVLGRAQFALEQSQARTTDHPTYSLNLLLNPSTVIEFEAWQAEGVRLDGRSGNTCSMGAGNSIGGYFEDKKRPYGMGNSFRVTLGGNALKAFKGNPLHNALTCVGTRLYTTGSAFHDPPKQHGYPGGHSRRAQLSMPHRERWTVGYVPIAG